MNRLIYATVTSIVFVGSAVAGLKDWDNRQKPPVSLSEAYDFVSQVLGRRGLTNQYFCVEAHIENEAWYFTMSDTNGIMQTMSVSFRMGTNSALTIDTMHGLVIGHRTWTKRDLDKYHPECRATGLIIDRGKDVVYVPLVLPDSPAKAAGVLTDDQIKLVGTNNLSAISLREVHELFLGKPGTVVKVTVNRKGDEALRTLEIVLGDVQLPFLHEDKKDK